jgi:phosphatidylinositol-3-phosphatase
MVSTRLRGAVLAAAVILAAAGCSGSGSHSSRTTGTSTAGAAPATAASSATSSATSSAASNPGASLPRPDHVVVVIEENRSAASVLGSPSAPYLDALARRGATFTQSYGVTHPSEPNYLALFSGSTHGLSDDSCPATGSPYASANLASALRSGGFTFATFSEDLPSAGSTVCSSGQYARKHNPVTDFSNVPADLSRPYGAFPADPSTLPTVSFVVPNLDHDMHDGTVSQADVWLHDHLDRYVTWAFTHHSLLVVTWDEDDHSAGNRIPTLFVGPMVRPGSYAERIDHYAVLRTLTALYGVAAPGLAASAPTISDVWSGG